MRITKTMRRVALLLMLPFLFAWSGVAYAAYGNVPYGTCAYGVSSSCNVHTTVTTPSGLKVTVNLTDGQVVPSTGYDVVITPLNGQGDSFASADIYIAGVKVATVYPAANGTATWHWDTDSYSSGEIKIVVFDSSGQTTDLPFTVIIGTASGSGSSGSVSDGAVTPASSGGWFGAQLVESVAGGAKTFIRSLPPSVVTAFPYLLFLLILIEIAVLMYQTRRELHEITRLRILAEREREIADMKQKFTALVSHYLRTPITILQAGAEGFAAEPNAGDLGRKLTAQIQSVAETVESIIDRTGVNRPAAPIVSGATAAAKLGIAKQLAIWLPVALVGMLVVLFIYLAVSINRYNASAISLFTQLVIFSMLVVFIYFVVRQRQIHRKSVATARLVYEQEQSVQAAQDQVISQAATDLNQQQTALAALLPGLPTESDNAKFIRTGFERMGKTVERFTIASQLKGSISTQPYVSASLEGLVGQAAAGVAPAVEQKHVVVRAVDSTDVFSRSPTLLSLVLASLIDNAVSFSNDNGTVEVGVDALPAATQLYVADHGEGLTPDEIENLFKPFSRLDDVETFNREGLGFSLYLDKLIMNYLGGDITVESAPRDVTRFKLTLPTPAFPKTK